MLFKAVVLVQNSGLQLAAGWQESKQEKSGKVFKTEKRKLSRFDC